MPHIFSCSKIGQTNFVKSRKLQGPIIMSSCIFAPCVFFPNFLQVLFLFYFKYKRRGFSFGEFSSSSKMVQTNFGFSTTRQRVQKYIQCIFSLLFSLLFLF